MEYDIAIKTQTLEKDNTVYLNVSKILRGRSRTPAMREQWPSGSKCSNDIKKIPVQTLYMLSQAEGPNLIMRLLVTRF